MNARILERRKGGSRALATAGLMSALVGCFASNADAALRTWTGAGPNAFWSTASNWSPNGAPQSGEDLAFPAGAPRRTNSNDLVDRTFGFIIFNGTNSDYTLTGNGIRLSGGINAVNIPQILEPQFVLEITLAQSLRFVADGAGISFGRLDLAGHTLTLNTTTSNSTCFSGSEIRGIGNVVKIGVGEVLFGGGAGNSYEGTTHVKEGTLLLGKGNLTEHVGVPGPLIIGDDDDEDFFVTTRGRVVLLRSNMIEDTAQIEFKNGTLDLNGFDETVGPMRILSGGVVTGTGTLFPTGDITSSTRFPVGFSDFIRGRVFLAGDVTFDLNSLRPLDISASISGPGGIIKEGRSVLTLGGTNDFTGPVMVNDGMLELEDRRALDGIAGVTLDDFGILGLVAVTITGKTLTINSRDGGMVSRFDECTWNGPIILNFTGMTKFTAGSVFNPAELRIPGSIQGTGGIWFGGGTVELLANNTFTGPVRSACELLLLNTGTGRPFSGPLEVGGRYNALDQDLGRLNVLQTNPVAEVRWFRDLQAAGLPLTVQSNGFVNVNSHSETFGTGSFFGGRVVADFLSFTGPVTVNPENATASLLGTLVLPTVNTFVVSNTLVPVGLYVDGTIVGAGGITKTGPGLMWIDGTGSYSGPVAIEGGVLHADSSTALGTRAAGTTVSAGATLSFGSSAEFMGEPLTLAGNGSQETNGALRSVFDIFITNNVVLNGPTMIRTEGTNSRIQILGVISGTGPLTKVGAGVFGFRGNTDNTYAGDTFAREGTVRLAKATGITSVPGHLIIGGGGGIFGASAIAEQASSFTILGSVTVNRGGLWNLNGFSEGFTVSLLDGRPPLTLNDGGDVQTGAGTLFLPIGGDVVVDPGNFPGSSSVISGNLGLDPGPHRFTVQSGFSGIGIGAPGLNVSAPISQTSSAADIVKDGPGEMRLGAANTFTGPVTVNEGTLTIAHANALGTIAAGTFVNGNSSLALDGRIEVRDETLTLHSTNASALLSVGPVTNGWSGNIILQRTAGIRVPDPIGGLTYSGVGTLGGTLNISGPGGFTKSGRGAFFITGFLSDANTYTGPTTIIEGLLEATRGRRNLSGNIVVTGTNTILRTGRASSTPFQSVLTVLPRGANVSVQNGALWTMNPTNTETLSRLDGDGRLEIGSGALLTITNDVSCTFSGTISGSGALNKYGPATFHITGNSPNYSGAATVFDGTYKVDAQVFNSPVTVKTSSILRGNGWVGDVAVESGGVVRADSDGPGRLGGSLQMSSANFQNGSVMGLAFYGPHPTGGDDQLFVDNAVTLTSPSLSSGFNYAPHDGDVITLIGKGAAGPVSGAISGFPEGAVRLMGGIPVVMSYVGGDGNDVTLTVTNLPLRSGGDVQLVNGNGGGVLMPDDCSQVRLVVTNRGPTPILGLRGSLRSLTPGVLVTVAESTYPDLAPNARGTNSPPFQVRTEPTFPCGGSVQFELILTASNFPPTAITYTMSGASGFGLDLDGRGDLVQLPVNAFPGVSNNFTIELWANPTANRTETVETNGGISGVSVPLRQLQRFAVFPDRGNLAYGLTHVSAGLSVGRNGISVYEHGTNHLPSRLVYSNAVSGWTHVAMVYANRRPQLYVNGTLVRSSSAPSLFQFVHASGSLGGSSQGDFGNFEGQLDEVRIWNVALNQSQIQSNMSRSLAGPEPNLITYFRCDEGSGNLLTDSAPASPNPSGVLTGGASFVLPGVLPFGGGCDSSGGACESCVVVHAQFPTNALQAVRQLTATGLPSACDPSKLCPGFDEFPDSPVRHVLHHFTNRSAVELCVTAQLRLGCPDVPANAFGAAGYVGEFLINQPCSNYLGDDGAAGEAPPPFSFRVPPRTNFVLVVTARTVEAVCDSYTVELFGLPCPPPTLHITKDDSPDRVLLRWSSAYPDFHLQSVNSFEGLAPFGFSNVSAPRVLAGGKFSVTNDVSEPRQFFRLLKP